MIYKVLNILLTAVNLVERCLFMTHSSIRTPLYIKVGKENKRLTHVHFNGRHYCHEVITTHGRIVATHDHLFQSSCNGHTSTITLQGIINLLKKNADVRIAYYNEEAKRKVYVKVNAVRDLKEKRVVYDLSVDSVTRLYLANNFYVHNCVTADTTIDVIDSQDGMEYTSVPIYELYYKNLQNPTWLDKLEYWLQRKINR